MKTALVTGGNRGIGKAIAAGLVARGHHVLIGVRDPDIGMAAAREIGAEFKKLDLVDPASLNEGRAWIGGVDILVNNAGILEEVNYLDDNTNYARSMQIMAHAPFELTRSVLPGMKTRGWGRIVNVSSGWGSFSEGFGGGGAYAIAKASLNALTHHSARLVPPSIKINAMCPGWVRTRMGGGAATRSPEEGAATALWLAELPEDGPSGGFFRDCKPIAW